MAEDSFDSLAAVQSKAFEESFDQFNAATECVFQWLDEKVVEAKLMMRKDCEFTLPKTPGRKKRVARRPLIPSISENDGLNPDSAAESKDKQNSDNKSIYEPPKKILRPSTRQSKMRNAATSDSEIDGLEIDENNQIGKENLSRKVLTKSARSTRASTRQSKLQKTINFSSSDVGRDIESSKSQSSPSSKPLSSSNDDSESDNNMDIFLPETVLSSGYVAAPRKDLDKLSVSSSKVVMKKLDIKKTFTVESDKNIGDDLLVSEKINNSGTFILSPKVAIYDTYCVDAQHNDKTYRNIKNCTVTLETAPIRDTFVISSPKAGFNNTTNGKPFLKSNSDGDETVKLLKTGDCNKQFKYKGSPRPIVSSLGKSPSVKSYVQAYERLHKEKNSLKSISEDRSPVPETCTVVLSPLKSSLQQIICSSTPALENKVDCNLEQKHAGKKLKIESSDSAFAKKCERLLISQSTVNGQNLLKDSSTFPRSRLQLANCNAVVTPINDKTIKIPECDTPVETPPVITLDKDDSIVLASPVENRKLVPQRKLVNSQSHSSLSRKKGTSSISRLLRSAHKSGSGWDSSKKIHTRSATSDSQTKSISKSSSLSRLNNISTTQTTFLPCSTLNKQPSAEEIEAKKLEEYKSRQKKAEETLRKKDEMMKQKIEQAKKKREIRLQRVNEIKKAKEAESLKMKQQLESLQQDMTRKEREREEKLKKQLMKRQMKTKLKLEEAEARRRLDEEARVAKLREQECLQKELENKHIRKREMEELERQQRLAENRRLQEERTIQAEKEKARLLQQRRQEQEKKEQEMKVKKLELEKLKGKEKVAREKAELEKIVLKEKVMREQLVKERELERQTKIMEEKSKLEEAQSKQNTSLQQKAILNNLTSHQKEAMDATYIKGNSSHGSDSDSYDMTPVKIKETVNLNPDNYDIEDLKSDDETDDESEPRKPIPEWASGCKLKAALIHQEYEPPNVQKLFGTLVEPDLAEIFTRQRKRFHKRTSSAIWNSPIPI